MVNFRKTAPITLKPIKIPTEWCKGFILAAVKACPSLTPAMIEGDPEAHRLMPRKIRVLKFELGRDRHVTKGKAYGEWHHAKQLALPDSNR